MGCCVKPQKGALNQATIAKGLTARAMYKKGAGHGTVSIDKVGKLETIKDTIKEQVPKYRIQDFYLQDDSASNDIKNNDDLNKLIKSVEGTSNRTLTFRILDAKEEINRGSKTGVNQASLIKIVDKDNYIAANGFILSEGLILTSTAVFSSKDKLDDIKKFYYYDPKEESYSKCYLDSDGVFCANSELGLVAISVKDKSGDKTPLPEDLKQHLKASEIPSKGIHIRAMKKYAKFTPTRPFDIENKTDDKFTIKADVDNTSAGSIVLDEEGNLLGFVAKPGGGSTTCVTMEAFLKWMADNLDSIAPHAVSLSLPEAKQKVMEKLRTFEEQEVEATALDFTSYAMIVLQQTNLLIYNVEKHTTASVPLPEGMLEGYSIVATQNKTFITGATAFNDKRWLMFDGKSVTQCNTLYSHQYHNSVAFQGTVYIISGRKGKHVENFSEDKQGFDVVPGLREPRMNFICVATPEAIYVAGGMKIKHGEAKTSRSIQRFEPVKWEKVDYKLPDHIVSPLVIPIKPQKVLVMGGVDKDWEARDSDKAYTFKFESGSKNGKDIELPKEMSKFDGVTVGALAGQYYSFYSNGDLLRWDPDLKKVFTTEMNYE